MKAIFQENFSKKSKTGKTMTLRHHFFTKERRSFFDNFKNVFRAHFDFERERNSDSSQTVSGREKNSQNDKEYSLKRVTRVSKTAVF
jgi:hypothetical protein